MASGSAKFYAVVSSNNSSVIIPYPSQQFDLGDATTVPENPSVAIPDLTQQFDLDDAITMPENPSSTNPDLPQQFDLDELLTMPENPQARQQEVVGLVSDMPTVNHVAGSCSVCMESFVKSEETARQISCGHVYHHNCIISWLLNGNSNSCPLCRREISG